MWSLSRRVLSAESDVSERPDAIELPERVAGHIRFEQVSFHYPAVEEATIKNVSFEVQPRATIAIVGTTGSGKSTLMNLIPCFYGFD